MLSPPPLSSSSLPSAARSRHPPAQVGLAALEVNEDGGGPPPGALQGPKLRFAIDVGAPKFAAPLPDDETVIMYETSRFEGKPELSMKKTTDEMVELYVEWLGGRHPVVAIEDPFATEDMTAFIKLKEKVDNALQLALDAGAPEEDETGEVMEEGGKYSDDVCRLGAVGGDPKCFLQVMGELVCNDANDIAKYDEMQGLNTLVLTLRKGKTVGGAIELVKKAQAQGWGVVVAAETEAGETDDNFIAHFAVGARRGARALGDEAEPVVPSLSPSFPSRRPLSLPSGRRARGPVQGRRARVYGACLQIQRDRAHR